MSAANEKTAMLIAGLVFLVPICLLAGLLDLYDVIFRIRLDTGGPHIVIIGSSKIYLSQFLRFMLGLAEMAIAAVLFRYCIIGIAVKRYGCNPPSIDDESNVQSKIPCFLFSRFIHEYLISRAKRAKAADISQPTPTTPEENQKGETTGGGK